jgi:hypothetical protein
MFTKFNRVLLASGLAISSVVLPLTAMAAGDFSFELEETSTLTWTPESSTQDLTLYTAQDETVIGSINIESNDIAGFTVGVTSNNQGILKTGGGTTDEQIPYTLYYGPEGGTLASITLTSGVGTKDEPFNSECASQGGCNRDVAISALGTAVNGKAHGVYTDTLTFTLTNK